VSDRSGERSPARPAGGRGAEPAPAEPLPPLGSWARLYALVIAALAVDLLLLGWFTEHYR
jgi:hypothetical protein